MTEPKILIDNSALCDMFSENGGATGQNILRDLVSAQDVNIPDIIRFEATQSAHIFSKDEAVSNTLKSLHNQLDPEKNTNARAFLQNSIDNDLDHKHPDYFPQRNAGERALIEKWNPGDTIVSDDGFFRNSQANDRFTMRVRPDMTPQLWSEIQASVMTTPQFLNMAAVENKIALTDHQDLAKSFPNGGYITPDEVSHRKTLLADGHDPKMVHSLPLESHASHAVGAASLAVNLAQGNYGAAAVDAAGMAAENKTVQEAVVETAAKIGGSSLIKVFTACAKRAPVIGAAVTLAFVAKEAGAHMLDGEYKLAGAATVAGLAEAGGNVLGFGMGDAAREATRGAMIAAGGDEFAAVEKSGIRELTETAYTVGKQMLASPEPKAPEGRVLTDILPTDMRSMTQGADEMGDRSEIRHVAVERTGLAANDPRNDLGALNQNPEGPKAHLLILADGRVQGPDEGGVPFDRNPSIAAGKNGETIGVMYAGQGPMNDAQWSTFGQISDYVAQQRQLEGRGGKPELMAGTTATADLLNLPTPRGSQLAQTTQTPAFHQRQAMGGMA